MTGRQASGVGRQVLPRFGKDHLTLADWRLGVLRHQQPRDRAGDLPATLDCGFDRSGGVTQRVVLERGAASEFPTAADDDVILGLLYLASRTGFPEIVRFTPAELLRIIRWPLKADSYARLRRALARFVKLTATYSGSWYDRARRQAETTLVTGIIAQAEVVTSRGRPRAGSIPASHVQWTEHFQRSLREGALVDIDLDLYFAWRRPGCKELYRHLNKTWHGGKKPRPYERDLKELACGHLGMKDSKDLKRNFQALVVEMEEAEYLTSRPVAERYLKQGVGRWRVRLELHGSRIRGSLTSQQDASPAREIALAYRVARFGEAAARPARHEVDQVARLLAVHSPEALQATLAEVAAAVKTLNAGDRFLGFAVSRWEDALARRVAAAAARSDALQQQSRVEEETERLREEQAAKGSRQRELLGLWQTLDEGEREAFRSQAVARAASNAVRRRLGRSSLAAPALEILAELERFRGDGECSLGAAPAVQYPSPSLS